MERDGKWAALRRTGVRRHGAARSADQTNRSVLSSCRTNNNYATALAAYGGVPANFAAYKSAMGAADVTYLQTVIAAALTNAIFAGSFQSALNAMAGWRFDHLKLSPGRPAVRGIRFLVHLTVRVSGIWTVSEQRMNP